MGMLRRLSSGAGVVLTFLVITLPGWIDDALESAEYVSEDTRRRAALQVPDPHR